MTYDYISMPVPTQFVPQVTELIASLFRAEGAADANAGRARNGAPGTEMGRSDDGFEWTSEQYQALLDKGVVSSRRMVALLNALSVDTPEALDVIAERTEHTHEELQAAVRWLGKFTDQSDLFPENEWCFRYQTFPDDDGRRGMKYWFTSNQKEAWGRASTGR